MERKEILERLVKIISEGLQLEFPDNYDESLRTWEGLGVDSIMAMQLIVYIEEEFDIEIPEDDLDENLFDTLGTLVDFIQSFVD